jgi:hypothetical protein
MTQYMVLADCRDRKRWNPGMFEFRSQAHSGTKPCQGDDGCFRPVAEHLGGWLGCDPGIESLQVVGGACSCLAGEDSGGSAEARPFIVITVLNSQYLLDNEDGIYALDN